jgi:tetratricopeptide (TPR) repeat protein
VERLGVVPPSELTRLRDLQAARERDVPWLSQELLKRGGLTPRQVAQVQSVLRESRDGTRELSASEIGAISKVETGPMVSVSKGTDRSEAVTGELHVAAQETLDIGVARARSERSEALTRELIRRGPPALGQVIGGRFELISELGRGAQGQVYRAWDVSLERDVALKLLRTDAPGQAQARFEREARIVSRLAHDGIVKVYDMGSGEGGLLYFAMELVEGRSLEELIDEEGALEIERAARIVEAIAFAMHHAHEAGLVHRDLKPGNVLLDEEEHAKVGDFGLVALAEGTRLTATRGVVGTPVYMAPEQAEGERIDRRADVYSLGAVLYECLVGQPPFSGATALEIFRKVVREDPRAPRKLRPEIPEPVESVCLRALEKRPRARYPTAYAFALDLRRAMEGERLAPQRASVIRHRAERALRAHPVALGLVVGVLVGVALTLALGPRSRVQLAGGGTPAPMASPLDLEGQRERATTRDRILTLAVRERARGLDGAALEWLGTLEVKISAGDHQTKIDAARSQALAGLCEFSRGRLGAARMALAQALELNPGEPLTAVGLALLLARTGDLEGAESALGEVLRRTPRSIEGHLQRAYLLRQLGRGGDALLAAERAVELGEPDPWPIAQLALARLLEAEGKVQDANWAVERVLERLGSRAHLGDDLPTAGRARLRALEAGLPRPLAQSVWLALDQRSWRAVFASQPRVDSSGIAVVVTALPGPK